MSLIETLPTVKPQKTGPTAAAVPPATTAPEVPAQLTASRFQEDTDDARSSIISQLRADAQQMDAHAASLRILGNHTRADAATDTARALRMAANHLEATP